MKKTIGRTFTAVVLLSAMGCSGTSDESLGEQQQLIAGGLNLAVFNDATQRWYYDVNGDGAWTTGVDFESAAGAFGGTGDIALSGYGDGLSCGSSGGRIGVYRPSTRQFLLDSNNNGIWNGTPTDRVVTNFLTAAAGFTDQPIIWSRLVNGGEFPTCRGVVGYFRTPNGGGSGTWYVDLNNNGVWDGAGIDGQYTWGVTGDIAVPLSDVNGVSRLTIFKPGTGQWIKDDGDRVWEGCGIDSCLTFGSPNTKPFGNPNGPRRGVSEGTSRHFDVNNSGVWDAGDASYTFGVAGVQAIVY